MSPAFLSSIASRWFVHRWQLLGVSVASMALVFATFRLAPPNLAFVATALTGPVIAGPWALLCACIWFHPERGNLQPRSKIVGKLPPNLQAGIRWYAALVLTLFTVAAVAVWPVLSLSWL
ncbi:hypothetical protein [Roseateles sp. LKC17W]|uniref:Uncharacterized protein n=1 Tax=Pelomonas margarita TaxID=3299031 RepID=A0ABW7FK91_9BURK